jgi:hypothetical protein
MGEGMDAEKLTTGQELVVRPADVEILPPVISISRAA